MLKIKNIAIRRPFLFGLGVVVAFSVLSTVAYPIHFLLPDTTIGLVLGDAASKIIIFSIFLAVLWRFGWIKASGLANLGNHRTWLGAAIILIYLLMLEVLAFTGDLTFPIDNPSLAITNLILSFSTGLVEETMFRGLVLVAMVLAWGQTRGGLAKAVILSSLVFGITHLFNALIRPLEVVHLQTVIVMMPGILYSALVLTSRSLWPAIIIHGLTNAAVNIKLIGQETYEETMVMWIIFGIGLLPLMFYSAYLIYKIPTPHQYSDASMAPVPVPTSGLEQSV